MTSNLSTTDPQSFLDELFEIDEYAAVIVANVWTSAVEDPQSVQYKAGRSVLDRQTVYPKCEFCTWPIRNNDQHSYCELQIDVIAEDDNGCTYCHDNGCPKCDPHFDDREDECPGGCGQPDGILCVCAELDSLARHNADPETRGSWWVA